MDYDYLTFVKKRKMAIAAFLVIGLTFGGVAGYLFNPWSSAVSIKNTNQYFDLIGFKNAKYNLANSISASMRAASERDLDAYSRLNVAIFSDMAWIDKNIESVFAITKADVKQLNNTSDIQGSSIAFVDVSYSHNESDHATKSASLVAGGLVSAAYRYKVISLLNGLRGDYVGQTAAVNQQVTGMVEQLQVTSRTLATVQAVIDQSKGNKDVAQLMISNLMNPGNEQVRFLPLSVQLAGLQIQKEQLTGSLEHLHFRRDLYAGLIEVFNEILSVASSDAGNVEYYTKMSTRSYWDQYLKKIEISADTGWKGEYTRSIIQGIVFNLKSLNDSYNAQRDQVFLREVKRKYSMKIFFAAGLALAGLMIGWLMVWDAGAWRVKRPVG